MDIYEYISTQMSGKIERRSNSILVPVIVCAVGVICLVLAYTAHPSDALQITLLTLGFILSFTGLVWAILCATHTLWHYHYLPTNSPMRDRTLYLSAEDFRYCSEVLNSGKTDALKTLCPIPSSNSVLHIVYSRDMKFALLQSGHRDTSQMEPTSPVVTLTGNEVASISSLLR